jgi:ATP/maltotriose-dependent transcriptional regulator MalT
VGPADRSGSVSAPAAPRRLGGVVSRPGLFALLDGAGCVTGASAGSGKTLLLASWIAVADLVIGSERHYGTASAIAS